MEITTISLRGDVPYKKALNAVAAARGIKVADLVREVLDAALGEELRPHVVRFVASNGDNNLRNSNTVSKKAG